MPTGSAIAAFNHKQLLGFQDLGLRGLAAIRASHVEATQARWDVDGVFNTKLTIDSPGASQIRINGSSKATDGLGHVLTISAAYKNVAQFQNTNAIVYHVGFMYAEVPGGLRINPRTQKPQFDRYTEEVGFAAAPTSVTDNGNGTITFNVNSVTEAGVSNAGRIVRVYKVVPADGALTIATALEECTVAFGANNTITTVGKFGQTTVSTTAGDYIVVCMGPRVSRNTDLSVVSGVVYVGTVTGNGGTPVTFSNANQTLLRTFVDASQVAYTPSLWLAPGATNVQAALDALVGGLANSNTGGATSGANRVGMYAPDWTARASGGIGNVADGAFSTSSTLYNFAIQADNAIKRRWSWLVKNDGTNGDADDVSGTSITNSMAGRPMWVRALNNAATTPYTWGSDTSGTSLSNYMVGEFGDITQANAHLRFTRLNQASGVRAVSGNKWERLWLDATAGASYRFGGSGQRSGLIAQLCGFNGGALLIDGCAATSNPDWGFNFRNGIVIPKDEATKAYASSVRFGQGTSAFIWSVWENMLVYGPSATQTTPAGSCPAVSFDNTVVGPLNAATVAAQSRPLVFRDCVFIMQRATDTTIISINGTAPVVYENCRFFGFIGHGTGAALTAAANANVTLRDCVIFDPEGSCIDFGPANGMSGLIDNCTFVAGFGSTAAIANPSPALFTGDANGLTILNSRIIINAPGVVRTNAGAPTNPMVKAVGTAISGLMVVKGLVIKIEGTAANFGNNYVFSSEPANGQHNRIVLEDVAIDCGTWQPVSTATNPLVVINAGSNSTVDTRVSRISLNNIGVPVTTDNTQTLMSLFGIMANGVTVGIPIGGAGTARYGSALTIGGGSKVRDVNIVNAPSSRVINAPIVVTGDNNVLDGIAKTLSPFDSTGTPTAKMIYCSGNGNKIGNFQAAASVTACNAIVIDGRDNLLHDVFLDTLSGSAFAPVQFLGLSNRRNRVVDSTFHYNGTTTPAVAISSQDSLVDSCTAYRSAGATAPFNNAAAGSVTGSTILSTTL